MSGTKLICARIANFRSLRLVEVTLEQLTVLVGENNSGKTSFLDALNVALGASRRAPTEEDIFLENTTSASPRDRAVRIDALFRPIDDSGIVIDKFPPGSPWTTIWGQGVSQDERDNDFVAIRTEFSWNLTKAEYELKRYFLTDWPAAVVDMEKARTNNRSVGASDIDPVSIFILDAKRDIEEDLRRQGSFWRRITSDLGLSSDDIAEIESALDALNADVLTKSEVLKHVKRVLDSIDSVVSGNPSGVTIAPVASSLREISRGIDIHFSTKGAASFPVSRHGMGTRSLATILVFRAFAEWRMAQAGDAPLHPLLGLEEPEAHLHPQAQRALHRLVAALPGQVIVSTHSPYFAGQAKLNALRHFSKAGSVTSVKAIDLTGLTPDDLRKIGDSVIDSRGDLLFARGVLLYEGNTEDQALPVFAREHWQHDLHELGLSFVSVGGAGSYLPFLRLLLALDIPWCVFSDGDSGATKTEDALRAAGVSEPANDTRYIRLAAGHDFESYLISSGYTVELCQAIDTVEETPNFLDQYIADMNGKPNKFTAKYHIHREYDSAGGRDRALYDLLSERKTKYARAIARSVVKNASGKPTVPERIESAFEVIHRR